MIDRTQLTEALAGYEPIKWGYPNIILEAARILAAFPTDEMVEAGAVALADKYPDTFGGSYAAPREVTRVVLGAVRRVMFDD